MKIGDIVLLVPKKARQNCYEHPIAKAPVRVKLLHGPDVNGLFGVEIMDLKDRRWLSKKKYSVASHSLEIIEGT